MSKSLKFNKLLFFLEEIIENERLKKTIEELMSHETQFLERCFRSLKNHNQLPKGKRSGNLLAEKPSFWMLQGTEMKIFFMQNNGREEDFISMYNKTIKDFFKII